MANLRTRIEEMLIEEIERRARESVELLDTKEIVEEIADDIDTMVYEKAKDMALEIAEEYINEEF